MHKNRSKDTNWLGTGEDETLIIEEFVDENFVTLKAGDSDNDILKKGKCCSHFSYKKSEGELIVLDIQGCGYPMFDPEVASSLRFFEEGTLFSVGNLFEQALEIFLKSHVYNKFCKLLA